MARKKKYPEHEAEEERLMNELLDLIVLVWTGEEEPELKTVAAETDLSPAKVRKLLITAGERDKKTYYRSDLAAVVLALYHKGISYAKETFGAEEVFLYATSFGGYLALKYIMDHGNPWKKVALRCPAVHMSEVLEQSIMTEENRALLAEGRDALVGFDRKIKVSPQFLHALQDADITGTGYRNHADKILILHGTKDEIVSFDAVRQYADKNRIRFVPVENADHRFIEPEKMEEAIQLIEQFLLASQQPD